MQIASNILAASSDMIGWAAIIVSLFDTIVMALVSIVIWRISQTVARHEKREERDETTIKQLGEHLHAASTKLIDERFRAISHEVNSHAQGLVITIDEMKLRLKDGETQFDSLASYDHKIELTVAAKFEQIKDWMMQSFAGRADLKDHERSVSGKFDSLQLRLGDIATQVGIVAQGRAKGARE